MTITCHYSKYYVEYKGWVSKYDELYWHGHSFKYNGLFINVQETFCSDEKESFIINNADVSGVLLVGNKVDTPDGRLKIENITIHKNGDIDLQLDSITKREMKNNNFNEIVKDLKLKIDQGVYDEIRYGKLATWCRRKLGYK